MIRKPFGIKAIIVILCISISISIPSFLNDIKAKKTILTDGIKVASPESQGMDSKLLQKADGFMAQTSANSFIVSRHGQVLLEKYYQGNNMYNSSNVFSVTKSFLSALIGIAIDKGYIKGVDQKISAYFPEFFRTNTEHAKDEITIKDLLTMTPGFVEDLGVMTGSKDWGKYILELPLHAEPGTKFQYASASSHLLSILLTKATKMSTQEFAYKNLFNKLGISERNWLKDPQNFYTGYANLYIRPREMLKFGMLFLNKGKWEGKQLISDKWVIESTNKHISTDDKFSGYGYQWRTNRVSGYNTFSAVGAGGQIISVVPELDLVIVFTSIGGQGNEVEYTELLEKYILPAITDKK